MEQPSSTKRPSPAVQHNVRAAFGLTRNLWTLSFYVVSTEVARRICEDDQAVIQAAKAGDIDQLRNLLGNVGFDHSIETDTEDASVALEVLNALISRDTGYEENMCQLQFSDDVLEKFCVSLDEINAVLEAEVHDLASAAAFLQAADATYFTGVGPLT